MSQDKSTPIPVELVHRLACLFDPYQLADLIETMEICREVGHGWYTIVIEGKPGKIDIDGTFHKKPRPDQASLWIHNKSGKES